MVLEVNFLDWQLAILQRPQLATLELELDVEVVRDLLILPSLVTVELATVE